MGHVQKWVGGRCHKLKQQLGRTKLADGLTIGAGVDSPNKKLTLSKTTSESQFEKIREIKMQ